MPKPRVGVAAWRKLAQAAVDDSSLRAVAVEIGMSPSGLDTFLKGTRPHPATLEKVRVWATRLGSTGRARIDAREIDAAIALLAHYVNAAPTVAEGQRRARVIVAKISPD